MTLKRGLEEAQQPERKRCRTQDEDVQDVHSLEYLIDTTLDFHEIWRELKTLGWTSMPPFDSEKRYRYILPDCSGDGQEGQDYLLGEEAVVQYYMQHCASGSSSDDISARQVAPANAASTVPAGITFAVRGSTKLDNAATSRVPSREGSGATTKTHPNSDFATANASTHQTECTAISSRQMFEGKGRKKRMCVVCRFEGRYPTEVTDYCRTHSVCLCKLVHGDANTPFTCPESTWTCWEKFHRFYLPNGLFSAKGNLRRSSRLATLWAQHRRDTSDDTPVPPTEK